MSEPLDVVLTSMRRESTMELAGMLKEVGKGSLKKLNQTLAKFCLQEGRSIRKARDYLNLMVESGLITYSKGKRTWSYNPDAEWELFQINI